MVLISSKKSFLIIALTAFIIPLISFGSRLESKNQKTSSGIKVYAQLRQIDEFSPITYRPIDSVEDDDDEDDLDATILAYQEVAATMILQMFMYLEQGYTLTEIMEGNSSLRSAKILCPELGIAFKDLEDLIDDGVLISEAELITVGAFQLGIQSFGVLMTACTTQKTVINTELSTSIDTLMYNLMAGLSMTEATDSDEFLSVVLKISTDLNDTLSVLNDALDGNMSIPDAFDFYNSALQIAISSASGDLVEFEVRKYLKETAYSTAVDDFVAYLEEGYTFEEALTMEVTLDYASKQSEYLSSTIMDMYDYVSDGYSIEEAYALCEADFDFAVAQAAELIETQWYISVTAQKVMVDNTIKSAFIGLQEGKTIGELLEENEELAYVVNIGSKMNAGFGDIQALIDEGLSMQEIEVEMHGDLANAISEAAELIADTYVVLYSNDFESSDFDDGQIWSEGISDADADIEDTDATAGYVSTETDATEEEETPEVDAEDIELTEDETTVTEEVSEEEEAEDDEATEDDVSIEDTTDVEEEETEEVETEEAETAEEETVADDDEEEEEVDETTTTA